MNAIPDHKLFDALAQCEDRRGQAVALDILRRVTGIIRLENIDLTPAALRADLLKALRGDRIDPDLLTLQQAAERIGCSYATASTRLKPAGRDATRVLYRTSDVERERERMALNAKRRADSAALLDAALKEVEGWPNTREAAKLARMSLSGFCRVVSGIETRRVGKLRYFNPRELQAWIDARKSQP